MYFNIFGIESSVSVFYAWLCATYLLQSVISIGFAVQLIHSL